MNRIPTREQVERLRQRYPAGTRIKLHSMDDAVLYDRLEQKFHDEAVVCAGLDLLVQLDKFPVPDLLDHDVVLNTADAAEF